VLNIPSFSVTDYKLYIKLQSLNPYATGLNFTCHLIILNGSATIVVVGSLRVNFKTDRFVLKECTILDYYAKGCADKLY